MTGYALAFPVHSKYKAMFNEKLLELRENGGKIILVKNVESPQTIRASSEEEIFSTFL